MTNVILRPYAADDKDAYLALYESAFPPSERKPFDYMLTSPAKDHYELLTVATPTTAVAGLVILAYAEQHGQVYALLDYLAISPEMRGHGVGHAVLPLVRAHSRKRGARLFLEIEASDPAADNAEQRVRRKAFYLSCGLTACGVTARMYGTRMELLSYPEDAEAVSFGMYCRLAEVCFPPDMGRPLPEVSL